MAIVLRDDNRFLVLDEEDMKIGRVYRVRHIVVYPSINSAKRWNRKTNHQTVEGYGLTKADLIPSAQGCTTEERLGGEVWA